MGKTTKNIGEVREGAVRLAPVRRTIEANLKVYGVCRL